MPETLTPAKLKDLTDLRRREAQALLAAGLFDGACYLCGYILELALKAAVCKNLKLAEYPPIKLAKTFKTHALDELLLLAGLQQAFEDEGNRNHDFAANWTLVSSFGPDDRYSSGRTLQDAERLLEAVNAPQDGVLQWLTRQW